ncbi:hypothetical protein [Cesiribacter sp. SM1]|uniref:hypothetical protein n=1 Tax=Cesiribacter sp. SM1 TaxID=2861196 RepID=UPI001CD1D0D6|nr:hypothetical protein [Cesiribacter sp. SM1]
MKKVIFTNLFSLLILISCSEQIDISPNDQPLQNVLKFYSEQEFKNSPDRIAKMTDEELDDWEKNHAFISFRSILKQANLEWDSLSTEDERNSFLMKYQDVVTIEDGNLKPKISIRLYQSIVNREGLYETYGHLNKVMGDFIVSVKKEDYGKLNKIRFIDDNNKENLPQGVQVIKYIGIDPDSEVNTRSNTLCSTNIQAEYFYNQSNCRDDRKVIISAKSYVLLNTISTYPYKQGAQPRVEIKVWPEIRSGTWCNWSKYLNPLKYKNVAFTVMALSDPNSVNPTLITRNIPDYAPTDEREHLIWDQAMGATVPRERNISAYPFTSFHGEATSRGVGDNWAVLDCQ